MWLPAGHGMPVEVNDLLSAERLVRYLPGDQCGCLLAMEYL